MSEYVIIIDNGHGEETSGRRSPDGSLLEYKYCREIASLIYDKLKTLGYNPYLLVPEDEDIALNVRVKRANSIYKENNKKVILVSIHCNAAASDGEWHTASGWQVIVSPNASDNSKKLATYLKEEADEEGLKVRLQYSDKAYFVQSLAICRDTNCPAVLTENLFMDNKEDVEFLLSDEGKETITNLHVNGIIKYLEG